MFGSFAEEEIDSGDFENFDDVDTKICPFSWSQTATHVYIIFKLPKENIKAKDLKGGINLDVENRRLTAKLENEDAPFIDITLAEPVAQPEEQQLWEIKKGHLIVTIKKELISQKHLHWQYLFKAKIYTDRDSDAPLGNEFENREQIREELKQFLVQFEELKTEFKSNKQQLFDQVQKTSEKLAEKDEIEDILTESVSALQTAAPAKAEHTSEDGDEEKAILDDVVSTAATVTSIETASDFSKERMVEKEVIDRVLDSVASETEEGKADTIYKEATNLMLQGQFSTSFKLFQIAADLGHAEARYQVADLLESSQASTALGFEKDVDKAFYYYSLAAYENHHLESIAKLAYCYFDGIGVDRSLDKAIILYAIAAMEGDANSMFSLGILYLKDEEKKDNNKALAWFLFATRRGLYSAAYHVGLIYREGLAGDKQLVSALKYFKLSKFWTARGVPTQIDETISRLQDQISQAENPTQKIISLDDDTDALLEETLNNLNQENDEHDVLIEEFNEEDDDDDYEDINEDEEEDTHQASTIQHTTGESRVLSTLPMSSSASKRGLESKSTSALTTLTTPGATALREDKKDEPGLLWGLAEAALSIGVGAGLVYFLTRK